ncbi:MAG TPA: diacylglycerol kinase family protein [Paenirhodobacter sp.]
MPQTPDHYDLSRCKVALILNPKAGKKDARGKVDHMRERISPAVRELKIHQVQKGAQIAEAAHQAVRDGADIVAAFGGDGTQSAVAGALAETGVAMAVLPGGTFNYFARELGVGDNLDQALDTLLGGHAGKRHLGAVNERIFINNASFGVYPEILERREGIYARWGRSRLAAYWSVLVALRELRDPMHLTITVDGKTRDVHTPLAFVARSAFQLDSLGLEGAQAVRDGHFALFLARRKTRLNLMAASLRLALGKVARGQDFDLIITDEMQIETRKSRRLIAFDGEKERQTGPFRLRVLHDALTVMIPKTVIIPKTGEE